MRTSLSSRARATNLEGRLKELIARFAQPGRLTWIGVRPARRAEMQLVAEVRIEAGGLSGDHGASTKRAVTLLQAEHLTTIGSFLGHTPVDPADLRRNLLVAGINLAALKGRPLRVGGALLQISGVCAPCSRMEETLGPGGYSAVRGHGGWCAEVIEPGRISVGDSVEPLTSQPERSL